MTSGLRPGRATYSECSLPSTPVPHRGKTVLRFPCNSSKSEWIWWSAFALTARISPTFYAEPAFSEPNRQENGQKRAALVVLLAVRAFFPVNHFPAFHAFVGSEEEGGRG
jgi:hypothetical protein